MQLPRLDNYTKFADADIKLCKFGGIACYVKDVLAYHIFQIKYHPSHISFRIDICPKFIFIGVYLQPEGAHYFNINMFSNLAKTIIDCHLKGLIPFIVGDFNSRPGHLESLSNGEWKYGTNKDIKVNKHGRTFFRDLCFAGNVKPVNGLIYGSRCFYSW